MQGQTNWNTSFPEAFDGRQGSPNNSVDRLASLSPVESRLSNNRLARHDGSISYTGTPSNRARDNGGWDFGESSSSGNNMNRQTLDDDSDMKLAWYSSCGASSVSLPPGPSTTRSTSYVGNQLTNMSDNIQNYSSAPLSFRPGHRQLRDNNCHSGLGAGRPHTLHEPGHAGMKETHVCRASTSNPGTSPYGSNISAENIESPGPLLGTWGSSCKRKALEGSSGHFCVGGSSTSNQPMENTVHHPVPGRCTASRSLSISPNLSTAGHLEQLNSRSGVGTSRVRSGCFTSSAVQGITENPVRNLAFRSSPGHSESVPFDTSRGASVALSTLYASQPHSSPISNSNSLELISPMTLPPNLNDILNEPFPNVDEAGGTHMNHWNGSFNSRRGRGSSSSSFQLPGERSFGAQEELSFRSSLRNIPEYPISGPAPDTRDIYGDQIDWSFTPETSLFSRNYAATSVSLSSGGRSSTPAWLPHRNQIPQDQRRFLEAVHWTPFPQTESDSGSQRSPFSHSHLASSSSSDEMATSSNVQHQSDRRPAAFSRDARGDGTSGRNILSAVENRHRLIRQVLSAMQRGADLRDEDYMFIDPYASELHDQHIDMMLDVDNMSYEELLALEEHIGNVSTGLSEEKITKSMKKRKCGAVKASQETEPCCICREDYGGGDDIGILDCGHEFHTSCIKKWLILKNLCPICKCTALET